MSSPETCLARFKAGNVPGTLAGWLVLAALAWAPGPASAWLDEADRYVASLNEPERRSALGLAEVRRPARIANRLELVFEADVGPAQRRRALRAIAQEFLDVLFRWERIAFASVVERDASGAIVDRITVRVTGGSGTGAAPPGARVP